LGLDTCWAPRTASASSACANGPPCTGTSHTCSIGGVPRASVPAEIRVTGPQPFYDFEAKYLGDTTEFDIPPAIDDDVITRVQQSAVAAFQALDCEGLARVDFFVCDDGRVVVNEINTMPGFTPSSMFPRMWAASGVDYTALVDRLVADAIRRGTGLR